MRCSNRPSNSSLCLINLGWLYDSSGNYDLSFYVAGFFIILCGVLLIILPAMKWTKQWREAKTKVFNTASLKRNGISQQNSMICEEDGGLKVTHLLAARTGDRNPV